RACFLVRKLMAEFVYNTAALEGNTYTYPEVKTLLDGVTVGGHLLSEQKQILNQKESWEALLSRVERGTFSPDLETFSFLNGIVAREEALYWGTFRDGNVRIGGTDWIPPKPGMLPGIFETGEKILQKLDDPVEKALAFFLFSARNQFFWDGNKRTGRLIMNGILLSHGLDAILVPVRRKQEFDETMLRFYDTGDATSAMEFLRSCSLTHRLSEKPGGEKIPRENTKGD
ncbi:MAG: Fic family protein, partial [Leptospirales bacterium]